MDEVDGGALEQAVDVFDVAAVAAQQAMLAQNPQVPQARLRLIGRLGDFGQGVVAFSTRIAERGWTLAETAHRLHLSPRTEVNQKRVFSCGLGAAW
jgi:hypothetical protein